MDNKIIIPDISMHQDVNTTPNKINFFKMREKSLGVIIKTGQNTWIDEDFNYNWTESKRAGLLRGAYWFYDSRVDPIKQAESFLSFVGNDKPEMGYWGDFEETYNGKYSGWENFLLFMNSLFVNTNRLVGVYTGPGYWNSVKPKSDADNNKFGKFPLWIANYKTDSPIIPKPWDNYLFWQFTAEGLGSDYGVESNNIDLNIFNGEDIKFKSLFGYREATIQENNKMRYSATTIYSGTNIRPFHNTDNTNIGRIANANTYVEGDEIFDAPEDLYKDGNKFQSIGDKWLKVNYNGVVGWIAIIHMGKLICKGFKSIDETTPPPPTTLADIPWSFEIGDDVTYIKQTVTGVLKAK